MSDAPLASAPTSSADERHASRAATERTEEARHRLVSNRLSNARLTVALIAAAAALWTVSPRSPAGVGWVALAGVVGFLVLVVVHDRVERRVQWHATVAGWHEDRRQRLARRWAELPPPWVPDVEQHPFGSDLDLFGRASVFELIGPPGTQAGRRRLGDWLLEPARDASVAARQEAVQELAAARELREQLAAHGVLVGGNAAFELTAFLEWAEEERWLLARPWLRGIVLALSLSTPALVLLQFFNVTDGAWWLATVTLALALSWAVRGPMERTLGRAIGWEPALRAYVDWLGTVEHPTFNAARLRLLQTTLTTPKQASRQIAAFQRLVTFAELRHSALMHLPVHALTLWDFHVWAALERWKRESGSQVRAWVDVLGEVEALVSLATLADDHPEWVMPEVSRETDVLAAHALGHPLLPPASCVTNDVKVGPPGRVLCITGSNMSGKSTLLRAIGVNAVLAQAGSPVCARQFTMPPVRLYTSLHVSDSLAEGVSFFMAALARLKQLVDAATATGPGDPVVLYLLDEILSGTNSVERATAVRIVLRHLIAARAIGAITTHDLALTETPELRDHGDHVHFRETLHPEGGVLTMTFDYRLRPGVATSRNALALLEMVGLGAVEHD